MTTQPKPHMTVDEFLVWAEAQPGRFELYNGVVYAMAPERTGHAETKHRVARALEDAIKAKGARCWMLPDGMTVRIDKDTAHEPDALVYCGKKLPGTAPEVPRPVVVVEVLSPSTRHIDASVKLAGYFSLPSVQHYLIVNPSGPPVLHHQRNADGTLLTRLVPATAMIELDPPGLSFNAGSLFRTR